MGTSGIQIPEDILFDNILIRLPVKSLKRFQCVHKSWNARIKSPKFVAEHLQFHNRNYPNQNCFLASIKSVCKSGHSLKLLNFKGSTIDNIDSLDWPNSPSRHRQIRGPSNGIYCFIDCFDDSLDYDFPTSMFLANISLREFKVVTLPPDQLSILYSRGETLIPNFYLEFGFDHKANDYKVVFITSVTYLKARRGRRSFEVAIYSLRSNSWKKVPECQTLQDTFGFNKQNSAALMNTFVHGNFHWAATSYDGEDCIISFDIVREAFRKIELTSSLCSTSLKDVTVKDVTELHGSLCLLSFSFPRDTGTTMAVWVMQEYGKKESWYKLYAIDLANVDKPIGLLPNDHIVKKVYRDWRIIYQYNGNTDTDTEPLRFYSTRIYSESLVSLKDYEGAHVTNPAKINMVEDRKM